MSRYSRWLAAAMRDCVDRWLLIAGIEGPSLIFSYSSASHSMSIMGGSRSTAAQRNAPCAQPSEAYSGMAVFNTDVT